MVFPIFTISKVMVRWLAPSLGMITGAAGTLTMDSDGSDVVAAFIGGVDVSVAGCQLCDGMNLPGGETNLSDASSWTVGFSAGSTQWIRTSPLSGNGFRGVVGTGYVDSSDATQTWPGDFAPFLDFPEAGEGIANYGAGLSDTAFAKVFSDSGVDYNVNFGTDASGNGFTNVTIVPAVPEPTSFSLLGLAGLALLGFRRR